MNKKGFTLVELLSVIVLLGVVLTLGTVGVASIKKRINDNMFTSKLDYILTAAKTWGGDHKDLINPAKSITVQELINAKYLKTEERNSDNKAAVLYDNDKTSVNNLEIKVTFENNRIYAGIEQSKAQTKYSTIPWDSFDKKTYYC